MKENWQTGLIAIFLMIKAKDGIQWLFDCNKAIKQRHQFEQAYIDDLQNLEFEEGNQINKSIYKGNQIEEQKKQKSIQVMRYCEGIALQFLNNYDFRFPLNLTQIFQEEISIEDILVSMNEFLLKNNNNEAILITAELINDRIQDLFQLFRVFFLQKLYLVDIQEEFDFHIPFISNYLYKSIKSKVKRSQQSVFKALYGPIKKSKQYFLNDFTFSKFNQQISQIYYERLRDIPDLIEKFYKEYLEKHQINLIKTFQFQLCDLLFHRYKEKLFQNFLKHIKLSFVYYQIDREIYQNDFKNSIIFLFHEYFQNGFSAGICDQDQNQSLQYIIYSIEWEQSLLEQVENLLIEIAKFNVHVFQLKSTLTKKKVLLTEILLNFKQEAKEDCIFAQKYWNECIKENKNLLIIFQICCIVSKINIAKPLIQFGDYEAKDRILLKKILRKLNNGYFNYQNIVMLNLFENIVHQLQKLLFNAIEKKLHKIELREAEESIMNNSLEVNFKGYIFELQIVEQKENFSQAAMNYYKKNHSFFKIISPISFNGNLIHEKFKKQNSFLEKLLKQIHDEIDLASKKIPFIQFELLSEEENNSNVITIVIAGFISKKQNKYKYWQKLLRQGSGTVIALHWDSKDLRDFFQTQSADDFANENPYLRAYDEAIKVGTYLGYLIQKHNLFGSRQINFIVHSLGSVLLFSCMEAMDILYTKYQNQYVNEIIMMGGAVDVRELYLLKWNSVAGRIHNVYIKNDTTLNKILKSLSKLNKPIGLQKIYLGYAQVLNHDMTGIVTNHCDYNEKICEIIAVTDFNNDLEYLTQKI